MASAADSVAQAVPGASLNQAAIMGIPSYFHDKSAMPYLPRCWFANSISAFFKAERTPAHSKAELGLEGTAPDLLVRAILSNK